MFRTTTLACLCLIVVSAMAHDTAGSGEEEQQQQPEVSQHKPTYDQRQTGKYNVNFNIKDVNIFTLEGDTVGGGIGDDLAYEDYEDYDYDNSHYTIHPIFGTLGATTKKPTTTAADSTNASEKPASTSLKPTSGSVTTTAKPQTTTVKATATTRKPQNAQLIYILRPNQTAETIALDYQESDQIPVEVIHGRRGTQKYRAGKPKRQYVRRPGYFRPKEGSIRYLSQNSRRTVERCSEGEYRDRSGACREKRANGIKRLLNFITSFTKHDDADDEAK